MRGVDLGGVGDYSGCENSDKGGAGGESGDWEGLEGG